MGSRIMRWIAGLALLCAAVGWVLPRPAAAQAQYQYQILHAFGSGQDGVSPVGRMAFDRQGNIYGVTYIGGTYNVGTVFELTPGVNGQWTETILHNFPSFPQDGGNPVGLVIDSSGNLYGTTTWGGLNDSGIVFELSPEANGQWTENILYNFCSLPDCADGGLPGAAPTLGPGGILYGEDRITAFQLTPGLSGWTFNLLYTFCSLPNCADGTDPTGGLTSDAKGNLYGVSGGAASNCGLIGCGQEFVLHPQLDGQWKEAVLYVFQGDADGAGPEGATLHDGRLYSATQAGGSYCFGGCGTVFGLSRGGGKTVNEQVLYDFGANATQGIVPVGGVSSDARGNLFGVTAEGGSSSCECGTVYGMKPQANSQWVYQVLHTFVGTDGITPNTAPTIDSRGNLYGEASAGGPNGGGVVFELSPMQTSPK